LTKSWSRCFRVENVLMRIGFQTAIWGEQINELDPALDAISCAGYAGVEFAQRPDAISEEHGQLTFETLKKRLDRFGLSLIGLANGTLQERMNFCGKCNQPHYLYTDFWDPAAIANAINQGFTVALHVHAYMGLRSVDEALEIIAQNPGLKWLPDTGHLQVLGEDIFSALKLPHESLAAVHLKDWTPVFGRAPHRYSRGFTELGKGIVPLEKTVQYLASSQYPGWLVVEQNYTHTDPFESLFFNAQWLYQRGLLHSQPRRPTLRHSEKRSTSAVQVITSATELRFRQVLSRIQVDQADRCYQHIACAFAELTDCQLVTVWICSPAHRILSLRGVYPEMRIDFQRLAVSKSLAGIAVERNSICRFDLGEPRPGSRYGKPDAVFGAGQLVREFGAREMISLPILNSYNKNHVRLVVDLFASDQGNPVFDEISPFATEVGRVADIVLDQACADAASSAAYIAGLQDKPQDLATDICALIKSIVGCEGVSLFAISRFSDRLEVLGTTGINWYVAPDQRFYSKGEGLTGRVWESMRAKLSARALEEPERLGKSSEIVISDLHSCLWAPLLTAAGQCIGLIRCQNKRIEYMGGFNMFSDDDIAIVESIAQVVLPRLQVFVADKLRYQALDRLTHELERPAAAINGAVQLIQEELRRRSIKVSTLMPYDYLSDISGWSELMVGLIENTDFFASRGRPMLDSKPTRLMADVIAPAVRQVEILLRERHFSPHKIEYGKLSAIPILLIDRNRMQQVIFNLLANAIKYAFNDPRAFQIEIDGQRLPREYHIFFRDWGEGIPLEYADRVFIEGFRAPIQGGGVKGHGLGLWIVREIIAAHGGSVKVTGHHMPTEISIFLPLWLETRSPESKDRRAYE
jgi:signal transduction histidine kinase/sugar phosphate isomerase/epimerase